MGAPAPFIDEREAWIRVKLQAGLPLDEADAAWLAALPPEDPLRHIHALPRVPRGAPPHP